MSDEFPDNAWYAVGGSDALASGDVIPVHLFGEERVAWRGDDGQSHVWQNRCVHRGMRLQYGFVDGDRLACRYHGWRFGGDARCEVIPAHPHMTPPDDYCIPAFQSADQGGLIWTAAGTPDEPPPEFPAGGEPLFCRTAAVSASPAATRQYVCRLATQEVAPGYFLMTNTYETSELTLAVAIQPSGKDCAQLHVVSATTTDGIDTQALRLYASAWTRRIRNAIEEQNRKEAVA